MPRWRRQLLKRRRRRSRAADRWLALERLYDQRRAELVEKSRLIQWPELPPLPVDELARAIERCQRDLLRTRIVSDLVEGFLAWTPALEQLFKGLLRE